MAFCTSCGTEGVTGEGFCRSCGAALPADPSGSTSAPPPTYGAPTAPPPGYGPPTAPPPPVGAAAGAHVSQFGPLADWGPRALGFLIDLALVIVADIVFFILAVIVHPLFFLEWIVAIGIALFFAWQVGETGQSPGMRVIGLKCISNQTGQVLGFGMGVVHALACIVNSIICYIGWLFPLWDNQRQTVADKIVSTYVITVPKQAFSVMPPS